MIEITFPNGGQIEINNGKVIRSGAVSKKFIGDVLSVMTGLDSPSVPDPDYVRALKIIEVLREGKITKDTYVSYDVPGRIY